MLHRNNKGSLGSKAKEKDLTENLLFFDSFQTTMSSSFLYILLSWSFSRKRFTLSTSKSLKGQEKQGAHPPSSTTKFQTSATQTSLEATKANKEGKETHNGLSPHHLYLISYHASYMHHKIHLNIIWIAIS